MACFLLLRVGRAATDPGLGSGAQLPTVGLPFGPAFGLEMPPLSPGWRLALGLPGPWEAGPLVSLQGSSSSSLSHTHMHARAATNATAQLRSPVLLCKV
jgi:hypothetical protein